MRDFARRRGVGITAAIKLAIEEATEEERKGIELVRQRIEPIWDQIRSMKSGEPHDHRSFVDKMWED